VFGAVLEAPISEDLRWVENKRRDWGCCCSDGVPGVVSAWTLPLLSFRPKKDERVVRTVPGRLGLPALAAAASELPFVMEVSAAEGSGEAPAVGKAAWRGVASSKTGLIGTGLWRNEDDGVGGSSWAWEGVVLPGDAWARSTAIVGAVGRGDSASMAGLS
jgi:hypothetical protein